MSVRTDVINLNVNVNGNKAQNELNNLRKRAADVKLEMEGLGKRTAEYAAKKKELAGITDAMTKLKQEIGLSALSQKELTAELKKLQALKGSVVPFSKEFKELDGQIKKVNDRLYDVRNGVQGFSSFFSKIKDEVKQFGVLAAGYLGFQFITSSFTNIIQGAAKTSDQLAKVRKTTGLTTEEITALNAALSKMDTRTSTTALRDLVIEAGKLGIQGKDNILGFVRAADQIKVALGEDLGDEAITKIGKLVNVFRLDEKFGIEQSLLKVGSAVNELGASSAATEGYIVDFTSRLAGIAPSANISIQDVAALGATLDSLGQQAELGSTAVGNVLSKLVTDFQGFADIAGLPAQKLKDTFEKDGALEALKLVLSGVKKTSGGFDEFITKLGDVGVEGSRAKAVFGVLADNLDKLSANQVVSNKAFQDGKSITQEFQLSNETFGATLDKLGKEIAGIAASLSGFAQAAVNGLVSFINVLKAIPNFIAENRTLIILLAGAYLTYQAAVLKSVGANVLHRASEIAKAVWMRINTGLTVLSTAAQAAYATVTGAATIKVGLLTLAQKILNTVLKANPLGIVIGLVTSAAAAFSFLTGKTKELTAEQKLNAEVQKRASDATSETIAKVEVLKKTLTDANASYAAKKAALDELIKINPAFINTLTLEANGHVKGIEAINAYIGALNAKATAEAKYSIYQDKIKRRQELLAEFRSKSLKDLSNVSDEQLISTFKASGFKGFNSAATDEGKKIGEFSEIIEQVDILSKDFDVLSQATGKSTAELKNLGTSAPPAVKKVGDTVASERTRIEGEIKKLEGSYDLLGSKDEKSKASNLASQKKLKDELDKLNSGTTKTETRSATKAGRDYESEKKEADKFYTDLLKLKQKAGLKDLPENDAEIEAVRQKYAELTSRAVKFFKDQIIDKKKFGEEEKLIEEAKQKEIDDIINKHIQKRQKEDAEKEYEASLLNTQKYFDEQRIIAAQSFADNKLTQQEYDAQLKKLDRDELADRITVSNDYSAHVKKAADDVTNYKKQQEQQTTKDLVDETVKRKEVADSEKLSRAQRGVLTAKGKGVDAEVEAKKTLLQTQFDLDTQYLDKKSELYQLKEQELQDAVAQTDNEGLQRKIENVMTYVGYFSDALSSLNTIISQNENKQLAKDKKKTESEKKGLKKQFDDKLISQAQFDKKQLQLDEEQERKEREVKRKQAIREKALNLFNAIVNNASAIVKTMSSVPFPANIPLAIAQGIAGGLQIKAIANSEIPELGTGDWLRTGDKHKDKSGGIPVKIERDEAVISAAAMTDKDVVTATGTTAQITSALNARKGGTAWAGGANVTMPKWRTDASAQLNPGLVKYMATGGMGSGKTESAASSVDMEQTNGLLRELINEQRENKEELKNMKTRLHAVVSIKEYRDTEAKYDAAKKASGISQ